MFNGLEFEKNILKELENVGIKTYQNPKLLAHNMEFQPDLLITNPTRAVIEFKFLQNSVIDDFGDALINYFGIHNKNTTLQEGDFNKKFLPIMKNFLSARSIFNEEGITCILILISNKGPIRKTLIEQLEEQVPFIKLIGLSLNIENIENIAAKKIEEILYLRAKTFKRSKQKTSLLPDISEDFRLLLDNFQAILKPKDFKIFYEEIISLDQEIIQKQNICAALKIGRALEFITLALAQSWRVKINKPIIKIIDDLDNDFSGLKNILIDYSYASKDQKDDKEKKFLNRVTDINKKLFYLTRTLEKIKPIETEKQRIPINILAALKEVEKKYSKIKNVRKELDVLNEKNHIKDLMELRNIAAHANVNGMNKDIDETSIKKMKEKFLTILLLLSNINNSIVNENGFNFKQ